MEIRHEHNKMKMSTFVRIWNKGEHAFHWHEKMEIVRCLEGRLSILMDGVKYNLCEGDVCVIGEQVVHKFILAEDETKIVIMQFPTVILLKSDSQIRPIQPLVKAEKLKSLPDVEEALCAVLDILIKNGCIEDGDNDEFVNNMYAGIYHLLMQSFPLNENKSAERKEKNDRNIFYDIVNYVSSNFCENINVQSVANVFYVDRGRLSKLFLKYSGVTLNDYINSMRLANVKMLTDGGMTVTAAALESGFGSLRTYNNVKKRIKAE